MVSFQLEYPKYTKKGSFLMKRFFTIMLIFTIFFSSFSLQVSAKDETSQNKVNYKVLGKKQNKILSSNVENTLQYDLEIKQKNKKYSADFNGSLNYKDQVIRFSVKDAHVTKFEYKNKPFFVVDADETYKINNKEVPVTYYIEKYGNRDYVAIAIGDFGSDNFEVLVSNEPVININERKSLSREKKKVSPSTKLSEGKVSILADFIEEDFDYADDTYSDGHTHKEELYLETDLYDNEDGSAIAVVSTYIDNVEEGLLDYYTFVNNVRAYKVNTIFELTDEDESEISGYFPEDEPSEDDWLDLISGFLNDVGVKSVYTETIQTLIESFGNDLTVDADSYGTKVEFTQYPDDDELMDLDRDGVGVAYKIRIDKDTNSTNDDLRVTTEVRFYSMVYDDSIGGSDYPFLFTDSGSLITVDLSEL